MAGVQERRTARIESILESLAPRAILLAINAVYFRDLWMTQFDPGETREGIIQLGMGTAFVPGQARFDAISPPPLAIWLDEVLHHAFVEVDEKGTEAAAMTSGILVLSSASAIFPDDR